MLEIDDDFFREETRNGFFVSSHIKRAYAAQMEVYEEIRHLCEKHGIRFFAGFGTLLGLIRHRGFIPWDDDVDIVMFRSDLNRFLEIAPKELPSGYEVYHHTLRQDYRDALTRVVNNSHIDWSEDHLKRFHDCPFVCGVDIFVLDKLPRDAGMIDAMCAVGVAIDNTLSLIWKSDFDDMKMQAVKEIEQATGASFDYTRPIDSQLISFMESIQGMYAGLPDSEYDEVATFHTLVHQTEKKGISRQAYSDVMWVNYENIVQMPVPIGYDEILTKNFGKDYVKPVIFETHDYPFFKRQQDEMRAMIGEHPELSHTLERFL